MTPRTPEADPARARWHAVGAAALAITLVAAVTSDLFGVSSSPLVGQPAPAFVREVTGGAGAAEHDRIDLEGLRGRVVVLDFWASWCPPCRASVPALESFATAHPELTVVGVNVEPNRSATFVRNAHAELGARYPTVHDADGSLGEVYRVTNLPTLLVVGPDGTILDSHVGAVDREWLEAHAASDASN